MARKLRNAGNASCQNFNLFFCPQIGSKLLLLILGTQTIETLHDMMSRTAAQWSIGMCLQRDLHSLSFLRYANLLDSVFT